MRFLLNRISITMKPKVYLETSFISYLTSNPSRDLIIAAHQQISNEWWFNRKDYFDLYISQLVFEEASKGDKDASEKRLKILSDLPILELNDNVTKLANKFIKEKVIPPKFIEDALHIAISTIHGMDYLLTWNCKHIANVSIRVAIENVCYQNEYSNPIICTPEELMED